MIPRHFFFIFSFTLIVTPSIAAETMTPTPAAHSDYYPTELGGRWAFEVKENDKKGPAKPVTVVCDKTGKIHNLNCLHLQSQDQRLSYWIQTKADAVYVVETSRSVLGLASLTISLDPPIPILKLPLKKGDHWEYQGWARTFIVSKPLHITYDNQGLKTVNINGKKYRAYQIVSSYSVEKGPEQTQTSWYAKGIGFIGSRSKEMEINFQDYIQPKAVTTPAIQLTKTKN